MDFILYYTNADGEQYSIAFSLGDSYETVDDFVEEFKFDHPDYAINDIFRE